MLKYNMRNKSSASSQVVTEHASIRRCSTKEGKNIAGVDEYFTAMLFHRKRIAFVKDKVFEFSNSVMGRKLQAAEVGSLDTWRRRSVAYTLR